MTTVPLPDSPESIDALYLALLLSEFRGRATEVGDIKIVPFKRGTSSAHLYTVVVRWCLRHEHGIWSGRRGSNPPHYCRCSVLVLASPCSCYWTSLLPVARLCPAVWNTPVRLFPLASQKKWSPSVFSPFCCAVVLQPGPRPPPSSKLG